MSASAPTRRSKSRSPAVRGSSSPALKLREKAYRSFTERLLAQDIRPGQFITQRELVGITGMSLGAVRELIPRLEADGLIKTVPQRGMQIAHVDLNLIRNAFQFRLILEREAAANFAEAATDDELDVLRESHVATLAAAKRGVTPELLRRAQQMDWDLHDLMIDRLGNDIISNAYRVNSIKIRLISFERVRMLPELVVSVMNEHLPIIEALQRRDPAGTVGRTRSAYRQRQSPGASDLDCDVRSWAVRTRLSSGKKHFRAPLQAGLSALCPAPETTSSAADCFGSGVRCWG